MKKALAFFSLAVLALSSCQTMVKTARTANAQSDIKSITVADLKVADKRVTATIDPVTKDLRKAGEKNVRQAVEAKALEMAGGADILLEPRYVMTKKSGLFRGKRITSISVSGRPAWYQNFRTLDDSVWSNPAFRGIAPVYSEKSKGKSTMFAQNPINFIQTKEPAFRHRGFQMYSDLYIGGGNYEDKNKNSGSKYKDDVSLEGMATASFGYQFGPYFYLGAGTGFHLKKLKDSDTPLKYVPVFYDLRFNASRSVNTWYVGTKIGTNISIDNYHNSDVESSILVIPSLGYSIGNLNVGIYFMHSEYKVKSSSSWSSYKSKVNINTWGINLGLRL